MYIKRIIPPFYSKVYTPNVFYICHTIDPQESSIYTVTGQLSELMQTRLTAAGFDLNSDYSLIEGDYPGTIGMVQFYRLDEVSTIEPSTEVTFPYIHHEDDPNSTGKPLLLNDLEQLEDPYWRP